MGFWNNSAYRTVSNALLKSKAMTISYRLLDNRWLVECKMAMSAAVVDPVGRNAYWSLKSSESYGFMIAGYKKFLTMTRSSVLLGMGVIDDIGW